MIRPSKDNLKQRDVRAASSQNGYCWFFLEKGDLAKKKNGERCAVWAEDNDRHYFVCPFCFVINEANTKGEVEDEGNIGPKENRGFGFIQNDRDLDSHACEVCQKCNQHMWVTFVGAVPRRICGALKINKKKCPECKKAPKIFEAVDVEFISGRSKATTIYACCGMRWK